MIIKKIEDVFWVFFLMFAICVCAFIVMSLFLLPDEVYTQRDRIDEIKIEIRSIKKDFNNLAVNSMRDHLAINEIFHNQLEIMGECYVRCD